MSSGDFNIIHLRNTTSYNPDGSYVSTGYIFTVSTNGRHRFTNDLNLNHLSASTLTLQSTLTINNLVVGSTLNVTSSLTSQSIGFSTLSGSTFTSQTGVVSSLTTSTLLTGEARFSTLSGSTLTTNTLGVSTLLGSTFTTTTGLVSSLTTSSLLTGDMIFSTMTGSSLITSNLTSNTINVSTLLGSSLVSNQINTSGLGVSTLLGSSLVATQINTSGLGVSTLVGSSLVSNQINASGLGVSTLIGSSLVTTDLLTSNLNVSTLVGSSLTTSGIITGSLNVSTLLGSTVIASSITFSAADFSTMIGSTMFLNMASISSLTISSIIAPNGFGSTGPTGLQGPAGSGGGGSGDGTGYTGPTGVAGPVGQTALVSRTPSTTQAITAGINQLVLWGALDSTQSTGDTNLTYSAGLFTNNSSISLPLAIDYTIILNTTGNGSSYVGLNGSTNAYGVFLNDTNIFSNSFTILLTPGSSFGIYYNDNATPVIQTTSRITVSRLLVGQQGPTGMQGGNSEVAIYAAYPAATQNITASTETLLLWGTQDVAQSSGTTGLTYSAGLFTNNNSGTLPLLIEYQVLLNTTNGGASYVKLNGSTFGSMLNDNNSFTNSFVVRLPPGQSLGVYYMDNGACVVQTTSRLSITLLVSGLGQTGAAGYIGADGRTGPTGYMGLDGPTGATGLQGPVGQVASLCVRPTSTQSFSAGVNTLALWGTVEIAQSAGNTGLIYSSGLFTNTTTTRLPLLVEYTIITDVTGTGSSYVSVGGTSYGPVIHTTNISTNSFTVFVSPSETVGIYYVDNSACVLQTTSRLRLSVLTAGEVGPTGPTGVTGPVGQVASLSSQPAATQAISASSVTAIKWATVDVTQSVNQTGLTYSSGTGLFQNSTSQWIPVLVEYSVYLDTTLGGYSFIGLNGTTNAFGGMYNDTNWFSNSYTVIVPAGQTVGVYYVDNGPCVVQTASRIRLSLLTAGSQGATGPSGPTGPTGWTGITGPTGNGLWQSSGANIYYEAGLVGIGTNGTPNASLDVYGAPGPNGIETVRSNTILPSGTGSNQIIQRWYGNSGNGGYVDLSWLRTSAGSDWTTAAQRLQAKTDITYQAWIQFNGTNNQHGLSFGSGYSTASPDGVVERIRLDTNGYVGIGTTNPLAPFHVNSSQLISDGYSLYVGPTSSGNAFRIHHTVNDCYLDYGSGKLSIRHSNGTSIDATPMEFFSSGNIAMIHNGGRLGVGTNDPTAPLTVYATEGMSICNTQSVNNTQTAVLGFNYGGGATSGTRDGFRMVAEPVNRDNGAGPYYDYGAQSSLIFQRKTNNLYSGGVNDLTYTEVMRIHGATGNVGIGITAPADSLDVGGTIISRKQSPCIGLLGDIDGAKWTMKLGNYNMYFGSDKGTYTGWDSFTYLTRTYQYGVVFTNTGGASIVGNVGIGIETPSDKLHIFSSGASTNVGMIIQNSTRQWRTGVRGDTSSIYAIQDDTASAIRMAIDSMGIVGIGVTNPSLGYSTTIPNARLTVYGGSVGSEGGIARLSIGGDARHYSAIEGKHITGGATNLSFMTCFGASTNNGNPETRMTIDSGGNVGIGITNPNTALSVSGGLSFPTINTAAGYNYTISNSSANTWYKVCIIGDPQAKVAFHIRGTVVGGGNPHATSSIDMVISPDNISTSIYTKLNQSDAYNGMSWSDFGLQYVSASSGAVLYVKSAVSGMIINLNIIASAKNGSSSNIFYTSSSSYTLSFSGSITNIIDTGIGTVNSQWDVYTTNQSLIVNSSAGNVGIGTNSPAASLHVNGYGLIGSTAAGNTNVSLNAGGPSNTRSLNVYYQSGGTLGSSAGDYSVIQSGYGGIANTLLCLNPSGGWVGIGTTSSNYPLTVYAATDPGINLLKDSTYGCNIGVASLSGNFSSSSAAGDSIIRTWAGKLILQSGTASAGVVINTSNYVGIGTNSPNTLFHVNGSAMLGGSIKYIEFGADSVDTSYIDFHSQDVRVIDYDARIMSIGGSTTSGGGKLYYTAASHVMSSNVGIGTTSPSAALHINASYTGTSSTNQFLLSNSANTNCQLIISVDGSGYAYFTPVNQGVTTTGLLPGLDNSVTLGNASYRWSYVYAVSGVVSTSDSTLKDSQPLTYGMNEILQMRTIKYKWKSQADLPDDNPEKNFEYYGFCADELNQVFPELVYDEDPSAPVQMNYSEILPVIVNALKEEHAAGVALKAVVEELKASNEELKASNEELKASLAEKSAKLDALLSWARAQGFSS